MKIAASSPVVLRLTRQGGAAVLVQTVVWTRGEGAPRRVVAVHMENPRQPLEVATLTLEPGRYHVSFTCQIAEALDGDYDYAFSLGGTAVFADVGHLASTAAVDDARRFHDEFELTIV